MTLSTEAKSFINITDNCNSVIIIEDGIRNLNVATQNELIRYYNKNTNGAVTDIKSLAVTMASIKL